MRTQAAIVAALLLRAACANAADVKPLPPFTNAYEPRGTDERGVWMMADEDERKLRDSPFVMNDPALRAYVRGVLCRTVGADRCAGARVYVIRTAALNAFMAPNGMVGVYSGLLLRMRNEAELGAVLGHEFAHFEQRHTLAGYKHARKMTDIAVWAGFLGAGLGTSVQTAAIGSIFSFNRDEEQQADLLGSRYMIGSGYQAAAPANVWGRVMDEADATALGRKQRSHRYDRVAFTADHPTNLEREQYLRRLAAESGTIGDPRAAEYATAMKPWRAQFLADQLKLNDFGGTEYLLGELAADGWSEDLLYARGELYRTRGNPRDLIVAAGFYRQAVALEPRHAEAYRGLGLASLRSGDAEAGRAALKRYLELSPAASDAAMMSTLIAS